MMHGCKNVNSELIIRGGRYYLTNYTKITMLSISNIETTTIVAFALAFAQASSSASCVS